MPNNPEDFGIDPATFEEMKEAAQRMVDEAKDPSTAVPTVILPDVSKVNEGETPAQAHIRVQRERGLNKGE